MSIAPFSTKLPSETAFPSDMIDHSRTRHPTAAVDNHLVLSMLWLAKHEASQLWDIMKWEISLPHYWLKSAMEWQLNPTYNCFLVSPWLIALQSPKTVLAWLDVAMYGFWGGRFEKAFVNVRVFNPMPNQIVMVPFHPYIAPWAREEKAI